MRIAPLLAFVGGLAGGLARPLPEPPPLTEPERVSRAAAACDLGDMAETLDALRAERAQTQARYDAVQAALNEVVGAPRPWPATAAAYGEEAVLTELANGLGPNFDVHSVDCSEYPCVALIELLGDDLEVRVAGQHRIRERLVELGHAPGLGAVTLHPDGAQTDWRMSTSLALPDPDVPVDAERTASRVREVGEFFK